jgi:hypothetical protein
VIAIEDKIVTLRRRGKVNSNKVSVVDVTESVPGGRFGVDPLFTLEDGTSSLEQFNGKKLVAVSNGRTTNQLVESTQVVRDEKARLFLEEIELMGGVGSRRLEARRGHDDSDHVGKTFQSHSSFEPTSRSGRSNVRC